MTPERQREFVEELIDNIKHELLADATKFHPDWDGHELRQLISERFVRAADPEPLSSSSERKTMTQYTYEHESHGRKETRINIPAFARDLAELLGAQIGPARSDIRDDDYRHLLIDDDLELSIYANRYGCKGRVHVTASARNVPFHDRPPYLDGRSIYKFPEAYVSVSRPLATIAKDIKRRVIDASAEPLANTRKYVEQRTQQRGGLADTVARLTKAVPEMQEYRNGSGGSDDPYSRTLHWSGPGAYLTARAYNDGQVGIDRIGHVSLEAFIEIAEVLRRHARKEAA